MRRGISGTLPGLLMVFLLSAIFIVIFLQPAYSASLPVPFGEGVLLIVVVELLAWAFIRSLTKPGILRIFLSITLLSLVTTFLITFFLAPNGIPGLTFDDIFLVLWVIHLAGYLTQWWVNFSNRHALGAPGSSRR